MASLHEVQEHEVEVRSAMQRRRTLIEGVLADLGSFIRELPAHELQALKSSPNPVLRYHAWRATK